MQVSDTNSIPFNDIGTLSFKVSLFRKTKHKYLGRFIQKEKIFVLRQTIKNDDSEIYVDLGQFAFPMHDWAVLPSGQDVTLNLNDPTKNAIGKIFITVEHRYVYVFIFLCVCAFMCLCFCVFLCFCVCVIVSLF
jgi:hypothetical protein